MADEQEIKIDTEALKRMTEPEPPKVQSNAQNQFNAQEPRDSKLYDRLGSLNTKELRILKQLFIEKSIATVNAEIGDKLISEGICKRTKEGLELVDELAGNMDANWTVTDLVFARDESEVEETILREKLGDKAYEARKAGL